MRVVLRSWIGSVLEAAAGWLQEGRPIPAADLVEVLVATLAELLRQAARLDPEIDVAAALSQWDRPT
ncbi:hypothetical protein ACFWP7_16405 [Streptomyces sp. NPDC058470]|uniref:hypothetical protein n=1 Tax=Streptomyces sp. NPDC058470 TaxID=3346515 RepID=UPI003657A164